jgi:hypothetical protein
MKQKCYCVEVLQGFGLAASYYYLSFDLSSGLCQTIRSSAREKFSQTTCRYATRRLFLLLPNLDVEGNRSIAICRSYAIYLSVYAWKCSALNCLLKWQCKRQQQQRRRRRRRQRRQLLLLRQKPQADSFSNA